MKSKLKEIFEIFKETSLHSAFRYLLFKTSLKIPSFFLKNKETDNKNILIGAGTYASSILMPSMSNAKILPNQIISKSNTSANNLANAWGFKNGDMTLKNFIVEDFDTNALVIATPHETHPEYIEIALKKDVYTYCEKPVAINKKGIIKLNNLVKHHSDNNKIMIGFNRRFAPAILKIMNLDFIENRKLPLELTYRINFGKRVDNSMTDENSGGGRLIGAGCHYVDLINFIIKSDVKDIYAVSSSDENTFSAVINFSDSSIATIIFTSDGDRNYDSKEEISISSSGHMIKINDFKKLKIDGKKHNIPKNSYGAFNAMSSFSASMNSKSAVPVSLTDGIISTSITLAIQESLKSKTKVSFSQYMEKLNQ
jgi:polar amino acid transport system substrate-binding protein